MVGLRKARETIDGAAAKVSASAETAARAIGVVGAIAVVALVIGLAAMVMVWRSHA